MRFYKKDLVTAVSETNNWVQSDAELAVNTVFDEITKCLKQGNEMQITGFGTFKTSKRKARKSVDLNGEPVKVKAHKLPTFSAGEVLKKAVNKKR